MNNFELISILITVLGSALGVYIAQRERLAKVETKVDILIKDVDGIAEYVGTPRAQARKFKNHNEEKKK